MFVELFRALSALYTRKRKLLNLRKRLLPGSGRRCPEIFDHQVIFAAETCVRTDVVGTVWHWHGRIYIGLTQIN